MSIDLTGITNKNEYYTNHYFSTIFEENAGEAITAWAQAAKSSEEIRTPWAQLRQNARQFYPLHDRYAGGALNLQLLAAIRTMADRYLASLGYPEAAPELVPVDASLSVPVYLEMKKSNGAPLLWVMLSASRESDAGILESNVFDGNIAEEDAFGAVHNDDLLELKNEDLATQILFGAAEPPRFLLFISLNQIALIDRNKWSEKRYLQFELEDIFSRLELTTLQAMVVLLHKDSLCPEDGSILLDELNEQSQKNAAGVSQDLKYALRECIELLGNEVLHDMRTRQKINLEEHPVDAGQLPSAPAVLHERMFPDAVRKFLGREYMRLVEELCVQRFVRQSLGRPGICLVAISNEISHNVLFVHHAVFFTQFLVQLNGVPLDIVGCE